MAAGLCYKLVKLVRAMALRAELMDEMRARHHLRAVGELVRVPLPKIPPRKPGRLEQLRCERNLHTACAGDSVEPGVGGVDAAAHGAKLTGDKGAVAP